MHELNTRINVPQSFSQFQTPDFSQSMSLYNQQILQPPPALENLNYYQPQLSLFQTTAVPQLQTDQIKPTIDVSQIKPHNNLITNSSSLYTTAETEKDLVQTQPSLNLPQIAQTRSNGFNKIKSEISDVNSFLSFPTQPKLHVKSETLTQNQNAVYQKQKKPSKKTIPKQVDQIIRTSSQAISINGNSALVCKPIMKSESANSKNTAIKYEYNFNNLIKNINLHEGDSSHQLVNKASHIIHSSHKLLNITEKILPKIQNICQNFQYTTNRIVKTLEQKLQKVQMKKEQMDESFNELESQNEIHSYVMKQLGNLSLMEQEINKNISMVSPLLENQVTQINFRSDLSIFMEDVSLLQTEYTKYDELIQKIDNDMLALKRKDQPYADIIEFKTLKENGETKVQKKTICSIDKIPQFVFVHQDRIIIDSEIYNIQEMNKIQDLPTDITSGCVIDNQNVLFGFASYGIVGLASWSGLQYSKILKNHPASSGGKNKFNKVRLMRKNPFCIDDMPEISMIESSGILRMMKINLGQFKQSSNRKLCNKVCDYAFVNDHLMIALISSEEIALIDYQQAVIIKQFQNRFANGAVIPHQFTTGLMQIIVRQSKDKKQLCIVDIEGQGFQGSNENIEQLSLVSQIWDTDICAQETVMIMMNPSGEIEIRRLIVE
ncbi:hypothetical protein OXYTRIMIC_685 [Oxytricha trifallax]|uniref:Uncharacterized protein n=1 Tax=Oxytricha trifallax TaxID=1172189 RepID=A0A073HZ87_9SPIT|nr:hypothetical protein OXYTRIMIC_685 [Oxytricha trifallax]